jgi:hypothetical protein
MIHEFLGTYSGNYAAMVDGPTLCPLLMVMRKDSLPGTRSEVTSSISCSLIVGYKIGLDSNNGVRYI